MGKHHYSEIPDTVVTKPFIPLGYNVYTLFREEGHEYLNKALDALSNKLYDLGVARLDEAIMTSRELMSGKVTHPDKTLLYAFFPPVITLSVDLQQGVNKLLYGESTSTAFCLVNDITREIAFILCSHQETGIPVDWWVTGPDDELLDRRHIKYGMKLRDIPKKIKSVHKVGELLMDVLKDIRNERTPQFSAASFVVCPVYGSGAANFLVENSNWEVLSGLCDGMNSKDLYKLPDYWFCYVPWPPFVRTMSLLGRGSFAKRLAGLSTNFRLYSQPVEDEMIPFLKELVPESWEVNFVRKWRDRGLPTPLMTTECQLPDFTKKETYQNEEFDWKYPENLRAIFLEDLGMNLEEALRGVFLDVTHESDPDLKIDRNFIISTGYGRKVKIFD
ncbi:MAG TPA: hypothetical protein VMV49_13735 [Candidatus Deferrimicrobium sp.]|nr:hypothetical protein [Candidatus Deferrimicrobium sp.]